MSPISQPDQQAENPRTTRVRQIILDAARGLLLNEGAGAVTAARICDETRVARTTIYRHFPDASALLLSAIDHIVVPHAPTIITDDVEADLTIALSNLRMRMTKNPFRRVFTALLDHANRDKSLVSAQRRFVNGVLQPIRDIVAAAIQRGDLASTINVDAVCAQLAGPLFLQHVMLRSKINDPLIKETIAHVLNQARATAGKETR